MSKYVDRNPIAEKRDAVTNWVLLAIHAEQKRKYHCPKFGFWDKLILWLKGKL
jgi:hypothetical protein